MKTHYKILWIDDDHRYVRGDKRNLKSFLGDHGIELLVEDIQVVHGHLPTEEQAFITAIEDLDLDMVFIDFNMPEKGDQIIRYIRRDLHHYHLPILFYTSDNNAQQTLQNSILAVNKTEDGADKVADGIYFCDRDHIADKAKLILTSLIKKESRPQQTRGLLMDRVSEIDANIMDCINSLWFKVPEEKQAKVVESVTKKIASKKNKAEQLETTLNRKNYEDIPDFIRENKLYIDTNSRAMILKSILKHIGNGGSNEKVLLELYNKTEEANNLIGIRNIYAHDTEEYISTNHHDEAQCKFIREESRRQVNNILDLLKQAN